MPPSGPDASNSCLPLTAPVIVSVPPVPSASRGERCPLDRKTGRLHTNQSLLAYASGKLVIIIIITTTTTTGNFRLLLQL
jgi:hypothetical protein